MLLKPVKSKNISAVGYDPMRGLLEVKFKMSGRIYAFLDVNRQLYQQMMQAGSIGHYFNTAIKDKHQSFQLK